MPVFTDLIELLAGSDEGSIETTVCVIGSGPAGAIVAVEMATAGIDVVLLEAGSSHPDHEISAGLDRVDVSGGTELNFGFSRQLGGATNLWSGRLAQFEPIDFEHRDWIPNSGWPISVRELERYYARSGSILGVPDPTLFHVHGDSRESLLPSGTIEIKSFQWARKPFHAGEHLKSAAAGSERLRVILKARVTMLEESENTQLVEAAAIALPNGGVARVRARCFVVAAGGIESPRLLLNSTAVRPAGIGNDHNVVGRYLSTHPKANMGSLILNQRVSTDYPLFSDRPLAGGVVRYGLGLTASVQERYRLLNHYVQLLPLLEHQANRLFEKVRGSRSVTSPLVDRTPLIRGIVPGLGLLAFDAIGRLGRVQRRAGKFVLRAFLDQYPSAANRLTLSEARDKTGMPKASIKWTFSDDDRRSVMAFFEILDRDIRSRGLGRIDYHRLKTTTDWPLTGIHSHFMGTTRMGDDPRASVTTAHGQVHGSHNLFVAGPSLFPVYGYANPVYTIAALALRLADHLKERLL
jgi:choline dehydrogenase-like flavoprotein